MRYLYITKAGLPVVALPMLINGVIVEVVLQYREERLMFIRWRVAVVYALQWCRNGRGGVSNHRRLDCLINRLFRRRSRKTSKLSVTGLCEENPPMAVGFPSQRANNAETVPICWRHHRQSWYLNNERVTRGHDPKDGFIVWRTINIISPIQFCSKVHRIGLFDYVPDKSFFELLLLNKGF